MNALLRADGIALTRGGRLLFEGRDLLVEPGDAVHLTGPNGSGKSSLMRLIAGLLLPNAGTIERADVALADDHLALDRDLPLARALGFWGGPKLAEALTAFDLDRLADVPVRMLSTGQARRARLARVVASDAPLWLLDEPLNGLDRDGVARLEKVIERHRDAAGAAIATSHGAMRGDWREWPL
ncbi:ATP-binding cassette domain-containing protein [Sphingomonas sp. LY29]|uniref:ABC transporter ATP-binding protein n=1 Tax=Sphingomonas sp. LY29 TaxID=3095341 RepID=UPI002D78A3BE|nr:ATP-binding cassette domain-containing protein [Sphingomonas sp. LY29]WRP25135.1 ATP-binding cassette domain-containing protein [Sphingomonas sp. LY29]